MDSKAWTLSEFAAEVIGARPRLDTVEGMHSTTPLRILLVNNSSAAAFRLVPPPADAVLADAPPAATWRAAAEGQVDA
ncbi:MAG TPA: hypothetical protein VF453_17340, partial [Burkholderiaceae bacterium]